MQTDTNTFSTKKEKQLICPVCGNIYLKNTKGRTKEYCSPNCQELNKYKNAFFDKLLQIDFKDKQAKEMKGELWRMANTIKFDRSKNKPRLKK